MLKRHLANGGHYIPADFNDSLSRCTSDRLNAPRLVSGGLPNHSANADVGIYAVIFKHICQELGVKTVENLYVDSGMAGIPTTMTLGKHFAILLADVPGDYKQWLLTQEDIDSYLRKDLGD